jgi:hypothetical protein
MNGKRAKALRRYGAGAARGDDIVRLSRGPFTNKPDDVLADIWSNADAAVAQADQSASDNSEQDQPKG